MLQRYMRGGHVACSRLAPPSTRNYQACNHTAAAATINFSVYVRS